MSRARLCCVGAWLLLLLAPAGAGAQEALPRTVLLIDAYARVAGPSFTDQVEPTITFERASVEVDYTSGTGIGGGVGLARRLSSRVGVLASVSFGAMAATATAAGTVPHPLYFDRPRDVAGAADVSGSQMIVDVLATGFWRAGSRWTVLAGAGPSIVRVSQDAVDGVTYTETFPYDSVTVTGLRTSTSSGVGVGVTGLLDVMWQLGPRTGLAAFMKYTAASVESGKDDATVTVKAGGLRAGLGLRFRW